MEEILINTGVYGIMLVGFINLIVLFVAYFRRILDHTEFFSLLALVVAITLIAGTVFIRDVRHMDWMYYAGLLASLVGLIALLLRVSKKLIRTPNR